MDKFKGLLALMALFAAVGCVSADFNESLFLIVNSLPIIALAATGIVTVVVAFLSLIIAIVLVSFVRDMLKLPLDMVKSVMKQK